MADSIRDRAPSLPDAAGRGKPPDPCRPPTPKDLIDDFKNNPESWDRVASLAEKASSRGARQIGVSVQTIWQNISTGDTLVEHMVIDDKGKVFDHHFRPNYKPRNDECQ